MLSIILAVLSITFCAFGTGAPVETNEALVRNVSLEKSQINLEEDFETYSISTDGNVPTFTGISEYYYDDGLFFDNLALEDEEENYRLSYFCSFDMEKLEYTFEIQVIDSEGTVIDKDTMVTPAFVTENGGLDAYITLGDETFLLSELESDIVNDCICGWLVALIVVAVVVCVVEIYHTVTETAENIKSLDNYKYNKALESSGNGVSKGNYIYGQEESSKSGYKCGDYHFGFTTFSGVGCEVASAYNALIALGKAEYLSKTIFTFEAIHIEYACGWGKLGSDPKAMTRFFDAREVKYTKYTDGVKFENAILKESNCHIIVSKWNSNSIFDGLHTFYIRKNRSAASDYVGYNFHNRKPQVTDNSSVITTYTGYKNYDNFIVGYIIQP